MQRLPRFEFEKAYFSFFRATKSLQLFILAPTRPYWPLLAPIGPYWPLLAPTRPYRYQGSLFSARHNCLDRRLNRLETPRCLARPILPDGPDSRFRFSKENPLLLTRKQRK